MATFALAASFAPLARASEKQLQSLGKALWPRNQCMQCESGSRCTGTQDSCFSQRIGRLRRYFEYYRDVTISYEPDVASQADPALSTHEDLVEIIGILKANPTAKRSEIAEKAFAHRAGRKPPSIIDQEHTLNLAVKVLMMINCSDEKQPSPLLEHGIYRSPWNLDTSLVRFLEDSFKTTDHPELSDAGEDAALEIRSKLSARKLKKNLRLSLQPTDDIRSHLKLDRKKGVLRIFHHTAFLKEHLRLTKHHPNASIDECIELGALPRQLALEALDSIQKILFPLSDPKSRTLLQSLVSTAGFDPDALRFESASIRGPDEKKDIAYLYFGAQLVELFEELQDPRPRGRLEKWLQRRSGARYVMMATLVGVVFAIVLGMAGLAVSSYQTWIAYQAWKHPVAG